VQQFSVGSPKPFAGYTKRDFAYIGIGASQELPYPAKVQLRGKVAEREADAQQASIEVTRADLADAVKADYLQLAYLQQKTAWKPKELTYPRARCTARPGRVSCVLCGSAVHCLSTRWTPSAGTNAALPSEPIYRAHEPAFQGGFFFAWKVLLSLYGCRIFRATGMDWRETWESGENSMARRTRLNRAFHRVQRDFDWSGRADSNCRPLAPQASALPG
jgi:hypothetical protein